jgi:probable blue pigment (indigoidine) exporter
LSRWLALVAGLVTSALWGSSFVLIRVGLDHAGPLTLGGLRYFLAYLVFVPLAAIGRLLPAVRTPRIWLALAALGILAYPVANGLLFPALAHVRPATASFIFNQQPLLVLLLGMLALGEWPRPLQVAGFAAAVAGGLVYFGAPEPGRSGGWLLVVAASALAFAAYSVLARAVARGGEVGTVALTAWPLGLGGLVMLVLGVGLEGWPRPSGALVLIVLWLALANTALAYALWNRALHRLQAFELNVLLALGPLETALIGWLVLGEVPRPQQWLGMAVALAGVLLVQLGGTTSRGRSTGERRAADTSSSLDRQSVRR